MIDFDYVSNFRFTCYECDKIEHNMRNCVEINVLINQEIVHWNDTDYLAWNKKNSHNILIWFIHDLLWKNNIVKQVKNWEIMTVMWMNIVLMYVIDAAIETYETIYT